MKFVRIDKETVNYEQLVIFISYEQRSVRLAKELAEAKFPGDVYGLYCEDLQCPTTTTNLAIVEGFFGDQLTKMPVSFRDPLPGIQAARRINWLRPTMFDVSCFNRGNLFPILWASGLGRSLYPNLFFSYSSPENYGTWLTRDYEAPSNLIGYTGRREFANERILICVVGYEAERALLTIEAAEPSHVILAVGTRPTKQEFLDRNSEAVEELLGSRNFQIVQIDVSDPNNSMDVFKEIISNCSRRASIAFAPLSTKLSCLGIWGAWLENRQIRVVDAQPRMYNTLDYSKGSASPTFFRVEW